MARIHQLIPIHRLFPRTTPFARLRTGIGGEMLAEFFGTFVLLLLGDGSVALAVAGLPGSGRQTLSVAPFGPADWLIIAWGWAFAVTFGVYVAGGVTGAHLNPAITLSMAARRGFPLRKVVPYWFAQVAGAFCGAATVYSVYSSAIDWYNATSHLSRPASVSTFSIFATFPASYFHGAWAGPFVDQVVGTAILVALVAALTDRRNQAPKANVAPLLVGLVVAVIGLAYGTNAGYAINPARDFGPRMFAWALGWGKLAFPGDVGAFHGYWWIPIAGPLLGGLVGIILYDFFVGQVLGARAKAEEPPQAGSVCTDTPPAVPAQPGPTARHQARARDPAPADPGQEKRS